MNVKLRVSIYAIAKKRFQVIEVSTGCAHAPFGRLPNQNMKVVGNYVPTQFQITLGALWWLRYVPILDPLFWGPQEIQDPS